MGRLESDSRILGWNQNQTLNKTFEFPWNLNERWADIMHH